VGWIIFDTIVNRNFLRVQVYEAMSDERATWGLMMVILIAMALLALLAVVNGCAYWTVKTPDNVVAYRGWPGDENTCVVHWDGEPAEVYHDCTCFWPDFPGAPCREWIRTKDNKFIPAHGE
jgi:hypothetical protein